jgi:RNA polymerase sigma-70 factor (ECF subfamily)
MLILLISTVTDGSGGDWRHLEPDSKAVGLSARVKRGEREAFEEMFDIYFEKLRRYAYYRTGDMDTAEDLAAEALTKGMESISGFEDRGDTLGPWLFGIIRNLLSRHREQASKAVHVELDESVACDERDGPESSVLETLTHEQLYRALEKLPDEQREVILLRFMERYDVRTVARITGKKPGAVRALQFRATTALRRILLIDKAEGYA